jgi:hypothetical protein
MFGVSPTYAIDERRQLHMNTGKILIGLALLLITISLVVHPASA